MSSDDETIIESILTKHLETALQIYARQIAEDVRSELMSKESVLLQSVESTLLTTISRRLLYVMINTIKEVVESALRKRSHIIEAKLREIIREELKRVSYSRMGQKTVTRVMSGDKDKERVLKELRECRIRLTNLSDRLGKLFNLIIKFEPRFHALPLIEQAGEMDIDELARMLRTPRDKIIEFLKVTSEAGITYMRGNKVVLLTPIFRAKK
ncbi:MAG: hypothetical protein ACTSX9_00760 [Candidatus Njordarchaeales archaeon]